MSTPYPQAPLRPGSSLAVLACVLTSSMLMACASGPLRVNTDVQAFSQTGSAPVWQGARYRFDVLPSQNGLNLNQLHAMTEARMATHGLVRDDTQARYAVQVSAHVRTTWVNDGWGAYPSPHMRPWGGWGFGVGYGFGPGFWGNGHFPPSSTYWRELRLAILDGQTRQTVYETRARSENPSREHDAIFATMLHAALQDFPQPTAGWQQVTLEALSPPPALGTTTPSTSAPMGKAAVHPADAPVPAASRPSPTAPATP